ncbi:hypothetical protein GCM10010423_65410 [Streptomyces levis]|uniref:Uncharacterized protein n=1 Tax=Streptomyces levis TaxID=285566 RepID=A0ABN3P0W1_9ACTN
MVTHKGVNNRTRAVTLERGLKQATELAEELRDMRGVLLGHEDIPEGVRGGPLALMEVADAYFGRACDIEQDILRQEREGKIRADSQLSRFRKAELRSFKEMAKSAVELGSRRLTAASLQFEQERLGRESV